MPQSQADRELVALLQLHLATLYEAGLGIGLAEAFGSPARALARGASLGEVVPRPGRAAIARLLDPSLGRQAEAELAGIRRRGIEILAWATPAYPPPLAELPGMPLLLHSRSRAGPPGPESWGVAVGVVGSRRPSPYGIRQARRFAGALALRGISVVSGLALGIDGEAHRAALDAGGRTIAVLGSGLGRIYPREHRQLAERIVDSGTGILPSEFPLEAPPKSFHFPMRNRILSGLSAAVLVIEAGEKSGSLITVRHALDQGRPVYVVPGRVDHPEALGCLRLLQDGAIPVIEPDDILPGTGEASSCDSGRERPPELGGRLGARLQALFAEEDSWHPDLIAERLGESPGEIISELARLEMEGLLRRLPGGSYARVG